MGDGPAAPAPAKLILFLFVMGEVSGVIKVEIQVCLSPVGKSSEQFIFPLTDHL